ncbi:hypothetical protein GWI33_018140 [Rhynchophorus ferrugineus]|uniref:Uncharacterized protein n=1 Tax=Rhynchophorus ferrugineus TaxID=354439 RepID=A0A834HYF8_RHYFE|nr:hypothetical protein GWI33_018140 [Rhynchophorus ferrugineus]
MSSWVNDCTKPNACLLTNRSRTYTFRTSEKTGCSMNWMDPALNSTVFTTDSGSMYQPGSVGQWCQLTVYGNGTHKNRLQYGELFDHPFWFSLCFFLRRCGGVEIERSLNPIGECRDLDRFEDSSCVSVILHF